jgi:hypothetical protein
MTQVNRDPHRTAYVYEPTHMVTAIFPDGVDVDALRTACAGAGFAPENVQVFQGEKGADTLDLKGERHSGWIQFRRNLERLFHSYDTWVFDQGEKALWSGGVVATATTGGDKARKARAVEIMKSHGGRGVRYWGPQSMEIFF